MSLTTNVILSHEQIVQKIRRIAFEVYEDNFGAKEIVFAGIKGSGFEFTELLKNQFDKIASIPSDITMITIDKTAPLQTFIEVDKDLKAMEGKVIVLVDDVLNTGRTLAYSIKPFLGIRIEKLQVAVLVDRGYHTFPIVPNFLGYELSTTVKQNVEADFSDPHKFVVTLN
ncbi:phosphoribosyltransferase [Flammeovirga sp. MY04]|uniref:phosphoribosyltransferase family protein n=1 Tax=Flammeovirga sp. MY04 TaxID=1191459 RepID=UPI000806423B|nr:phosphoribosyltransferase family protein [Flammeovirga sp. MY04]ANQ50626.1 phosphoribosyltransferase [Flammeovirga sp. MY04]